MFPFTQSECSIKAAQLSTFSTIFCVALFVFGWLLTRGANLQKHACKIGKSSFAFGLIPMHTLPGSRGRILVSGFWGVSRHVNYAGEILQAVALVLPAFFACGSLLPLAYPAYYLALFIPRVRFTFSYCIIIAPICVVLCRLLMTTSNVASNMARASGRRTRLGYRTSSFLVFGKHK